MSLWSIRTEAELRFRMISIRWDKDGCPTASIDERLSAKQQEKLIVRDDVYLIPGESGVCINFFLKLFSSVIHDC
jgi:hypothetical protein